MKYAIEPLNMRAAYVDWNMRDGYSRKGGHFISLDKVEEKKSVLRLRSSTVGIVIVRKSTFLRHCHTVECKSNRRSASGYRWSKKSALSQ